MWIFDSLSHLRASSIYLPRGFLIIFSSCFAAALLEQHSHNRGMEFQVFASSLLSSRSASFLSLAAVLVFICTQQHQHHQQQTERQFIVFYFADFIFMLDKTGWVLAKLQHTERSNDNIIIMIIEKVFNENQMKFFCRGYFTCFRVNDLLWLYRLQWESYVVPCGDDFIFIE